MSAFETRDVVLDQTAEANDFNGVSPEGVLIMVSQRHEQKNAGQKYDDNDSDGGAGEQLEMKMPLTEKPVAEAAEDRPPAPFRLCRYSGVERRIYHKCV